MAGAIRSAILAIVCGITAFLGTIFLFLAVILLVSFYDVTMAEIVKESCATGGGASCYYPVMSRILGSVGIGIGIIGFGIGIIVAIIITVGVFLKVRRFKSKPPAHHFIRDLRHELVEVEHEVKQELEHHEVKHEP
jgi:predicted permease